MPPRKSRSRRSKLPKRINSSTIQRRLLKEHCDADAYWAGSRAAYGRGAAAAAAAGAAAAAAAGSMPPPPPPAARKRARSADDGVPRGSYGGKTMRSLLRKTGTRFAKQAVPMAADYAAMYGVPRGVTEGIYQMAGNAVKGRGCYSGVASMLMSPEYNANDLIVGGSDSIPRMFSNPDEIGALYVSHSEHVADIIAPADGKFHLKSFSINPGLEKTFPWLSQIASSYDEFEIVQCIYQYKGHDIIGIQDSLDLQGQVFAASKYNVKERAFTDRRSMESYAHSTCCAMNGSLLSGVEADPAKVAGDCHYYTRTGGLKADEDQSDFDHATFYLGLERTPTDLFNKQVGKLYVKYTVKLMKPKLYAGRGLAISTYQQYSHSTEETFPYGTLDSTSSQALVASTNSLEMVYGCAANNVTFTFPAAASGLYRVRLIVQGTNLDTGVVEQGDLGVTGECVLNYQFPNTGSAAATTVYHGLERNTIGTFTTFDVRVSPQIGNVSNSFTLTGMEYSSSSDTVTRSSVSVMEINDMDEPDPLVLPEVKGLTTNTVVALA